MVHSSDKKKYTSLVISSTLHALVLSLLIFRRMNQTKESLVPLRNNPADISLYLPAPAAPAQKNQPTIQQEEHISGKQQSDQSSKSADSATIGHDQTVPLQTKQSGIVGAQNKLEAENTSGSGSISPGSFMQAFQAVVKAERNGTYANEGVEGSQIPLHVKESLQKWGEVSYKQRIIEGLLAADKRLARHIKSDRTLKKRVQVTVTIKKDGSLGDIIYHQISGIPEIDRYLKDLIKSIDFAPIPDRFNVSSYPFFFTIAFTLYEGTNYIRLVVE